MDVLEIAHAALQWKTTRYKVTRECKLWGRNSGAWQQAEFLRIYRDTEQYLKIGFSHDLAPV